MPLSRRLTRQFRHVRDLGYRYMLQTDDDALVDEKVEARAHTHAHARQRSSHRARL